MSMNWQETSFIIQMLINLLLGGFFMQVIRKKIDEISFDPANVRLHNEKNIDAIKASLNRFGQQQPIVVDENMVVRAGNGRLEAARQLGWTHINVVVSDLDKVDLVAYSIADNRTGETSSWDEDGLREQLASLDDELRDIAYSDFDLADLDLDDDKSETSEKDDEIPELEDDNPYGVELGDIWQLGNHRVMCGDSTVKENLDKLMDGQKADMVYTDPPYGMNLNTDYSDQKASNHLIFPRIAKKHKKILNDDIKYDPSLLLKIFEYVDELFLWGFDYYMDKLPVGCPIVWDKTGGNDSLMQAGFGSNFELCWSKTSHKRDLIRYTYKGVAGMKPEDGNRVHPTQKPVGLACYFFDKWGKDKTNIVDLFLGSGSTLIACEKTNRTCFGCELDPHYVSVIINRWEQFTGQKASRL